MPYQNLCTCNFCLSNEMPQLCMTCTRRAENCECVVVTHHVRPNYHPAPVRWLCSCATCIDNSWLFCVTCNRHTDQSHGMLSSTVRCNCPITPPPRPTQRLCECSTCRDGMGYCETCGRYVRRDSDAENASRCECEVVSSHTFRDTSRCGNCGEQYASSTGHICAPEDDDEYDDSCGSCGYGICECECDDDGDSSVIHYHDYTPRLEFYGDGPLFLGFELETAVSLGRLAWAAQLVQDAAGPIVYLKEDGSISNGFEIVTHPMSYEYAIDQFPWHVLDEMRKASIGPDQTTGLHVHVSREAFGSASHIYRWMKMIYRNQPFIETIARRQSNRWSEWTQRDAIIGVAKGEDSYYRDGRRRDSSQGRYVAINPENEATLEVRIFNSTNDRQELQAALGLVDASVRYAGVLTANDIITSDAWSWGAFKDWLCPDRYAPLKREMSKLCV